MVEHKSISLAMSENQLRKMSNGHKVQIAPHMVGHGMKLKLPEDHVKIIMDAKKRNKGVKVQLTKAQGGDLKGILKAGWNAYKTNIKPVVGPQIRKALSTGIKAGLPALATAVAGPEATAPAAWIANQFADKAVNALGDATQAFGLRRHRKHVTPVQHHTMYRPPVHSRLHEYTLPDLPDFSTSAYVHGGRMRQHSHTVHKHLHLKNGRLHSAGSFLPA